VSKTILIVDDEPLLLEVIQFAIEEEGHMVVTANSVDDAIEKLGKHAIDAILSDVRMPKRSGIELLEHIKNSHPHLPFMFMSGYSELNDEKAKKIGARGLIEKPIDLASVGNLVKRIIEL
jgi:DNA-binding NtrC family response regulator